MTFGTLCGEGGCWQPRGHDGPHGDHVGGYIEWWDDPDVDTPGAEGFNARYYRHRGCDEGDAPWVVPQDGASPPSAWDYECARCCVVFPLTARTVEAAS